MNATATPCFHCGEPLPAGVTLRVEVAGAAQPMCCAGCAAAATAIRDAGLADFYRFRSAPSARAADAPGTDRWAAYDAPGVATRWTTDGADGQRTVHLLLDGVSCAACTWLVERRLRQEPGITGASANPATARVRVSFDPARTGLATVLRTIAGVGFRPHVLGEADTQQLAQRERATLLRRLAVAGLGMMQVMMFALALYAGAFDGMDPVLHRFLVLVSLLVTLPVAFYAGWPFISGALRSLRAREVGMDVTVTIAILVAFAGSTWNALTGRGEVWFDSVVMFVFLLLVARYAEMSVRHAAGSTTEALRRLLPATARRRTADGFEAVACEVLQPGDLVLVPGGEAFPADAVITGAATRADEAMLTGEAVAVPKPVGTTVLAGSLNAGPTTECRITATGERTTLSGIVRLLDQAQAGRPALAQRADRLAGRFLAALLGLAALVAVGWAWADPQRLVPAVIAVLVVACPCALSLAVPTVLTAALRRLARRGVLVVTPSALERLPALTDIVFDKTGTLTLGHPVVEDIHCCGTLAPAAALQVAAALEAGASHPLARAFPSNVTPAAELLAVPGEGLEGVVDGVRVRIGRASFVAALAGPAPALPAEATVCLGTERGWAAAFTVRDALRPGVAQLVQDLRARGLAVHLVSGDRAAAVDAVADALGIGERAAEARPADKVAYVQRLQAAGRRVAMVGDGLNDAPVLAAADVSFALQEGTALARAQADIVLGGGSAQGPQGLLAALDTARRGHALVRQNLHWSAAYNLLAVPAAALGFVPPWLAAIGMSGSSLGVVLNALRITREEVSHGQPVVDRPAQPRAGRGGLVGVLLGRRRRPV